MVQDRLCLVRTSQDTLQLVTATAHPALQAWLADRSAWP